MPAGPPLPDDDPNEAYEVAPMPAESQFLAGWWSCLCNGVPMWHHSDRAVMERLASDPAARVEIRRKSIKLWDRKPPG